MKLEEFKRHCEEYISTNQLIVSSEDLGNLVDGFGAARGFRVTDDLTPNQVYAMAGFYFRGKEAAVSQVSRGLAC